MIMSTCSLKMIVQEPFRQSPQVIQPEATCTNYDHALSATCSIMYACTRIIAMKHSIPHCYTTNNYQMYNQVE